MATIMEMIGATGVTVDTEQDFSLEIPVLDEMQRQGDVLVMPGNVTATTPVPPTGTPVVRGENGGNTHAIFLNLDRAPVFCDVVTTRALRIATLYVPEGSTAYLGHPQHGYQGIAPGRYEIRRQREQADKIRIVAD